MEQSHGINADYFFWAVVMGVAMALVYDVFRILRRVSKRSVAGINLEDFLFILMCAAALFYVSYTKNGGQMRMHGFIGATAGFAFYRLVIGNIIVNAMVAVYGFLIRLAAAILKIILFPLTLVCKIMAKPLTVIGWYSYRKMERFARIRRIKKKKFSLQRKRKRIKINNGSENDKK